MERTIFYSEIPSSTEALRPTVESAVATLVAYGWIDAERVFYAHLCLEEALVNAITHGNQFEEERKVRLQIQEFNDHCIFRIWDEGKGFHVDAVDPPDDKALGGRGICLIKHCMEDVAYDNDEHCLVMKMKRKAWSKGVSSHE